MRVAVVAALPEEIAPLARRLADAKPQPVGRWIECAIEDREICLMSCGDGARSAHRSVRGLLAATQPQVLIGIGSGGGLSANLAVGDLMVADRVLDEASGRAFAPGGSRWLERGRAAGTLRRGTIVSAEAIAWRREDKIRLARLASSTSAVVDLESGAWAAVATEAGVPACSARRAIGWTLKPLRPYLSPNRTQPGSHHRSTRFARWWRRCCRCLQCAQRASSKKRSPNSV